MASLAIFVIVVAGILISWLRLRIERKRYRKDINTRKRGKGYIYFFRGARENPFKVKIGRSVDPISRLRQHRTGNPYGLHVFAVVRVKDDVQAETHIHHKFERERISTSNEWFTLSPRIWFYMKAVRDPELTERVRAAL